MIQIKAEVHSCALHTFYPAKLRTATSLRILSSTCSIVIVVESKTIASSAGFNGAILRLVSRSSRARISSSKLVRVTVSPLSFNCK